MDFQNRKIFFGYNLCRKWESKFVPQMKIYNYFESHFQFRNDKELRNKKVMLVFLWYMGIKSEEINLMNEYFNKIYWICFYLLFFNIRTLQKCSPKAKRDLKITCLALFTDLYRFFFVQNIDKKLVSGVVLRKTNNRK